MRPAFCHTMLHVLHFNVKLLSQFSHLFILTPILVCYCNTVFVSGLVWCRKYCGRNQNAFVFSISITQQMLPFPVKSQNTIQQNMSLYWYISADKLIYKLTNMFSIKKKVSWVTFEFQARNIILNHIMFRWGLSPEIVESRVFPSALPIILLLCLCIRCSSETRNHRPLETCPGGGGRHTDMHHIWQQTGCWHPMVQKRQGGAR